MSSHVQGHNFFGSQRAKSRKGWTLVELLVVISLSVMMMGVVTAFLRIIFQSSAGARRDANLQTSVARLSDAFRADVHSAEQATIQDGSLQLKTRSGAIIQYRKTDRGVRRDETHVDGQSRRDGFWLPAAWEVRWDVPTSSKRSLIGITIDSSDARPGLEAGAFGPLAIRAALAGPDMKPNDSVRPENSTDEDSVE